MELRSSDLERILLRAVAYLYIVIEVLNNHKSLNNFLLTPECSIDQIHSSYHGIMQKVPARGNSSHWKIILPSVLPQGFSFHLMPEAPWQPCWQRLSRGGDEWIHFPASHAKLRLQPPDGCISRLCQLLLTAMSTSSWDYTFQQLSYLLHPVGTSHPTFPSAT